MDSKPLPEVPMDLPRRLTVLSVDARAHRAQFIQHSLAECNEVPQGQRDAWTAALELALDNLSEKAANDDWLAGIRKTRQLKKPVPSPEDRREDPTDDRSSTRSQAHSKASNASSSTASHEQQPSDSTVSASNSDRSSPSPLDQLRALAAKPFVPGPQPPLKHLLLCLAPLGSRILLPAEDSGFDIIPGNVGCIFQPGFFALPEIEQDDTAPAILYGLNNFETTIADPLPQHAIKVVGGTFTFKGISSPLEHNALSRVLRVSLYLHLSLLLEQHFLSDVNVPLTFPKPRPPPLPHTPSSVMSTMTSPTSADSRRNRNSFIPNGILSFFSKKSLSRTPTPTTSRGGSLDRGSSPDFHSSDERPVRASLEGSGHFRRFSFISDGPSFLKSPPPKDEEPPYTEALKRIDESKNFLSTSAGISFDPPSLLKYIVEKEKTTPKLKLKGDERAGLSSLLGWEGKEARGKAMSGIQGFVAQQELSVLISRHVPTTPTPSDTASVNSSMSISDAPARYTPCERPRWVTYRYYSPTEDKSLGETIIQWVSRSGLPCTITGCQAKEGQHEVRIIHAGTRIVVTVEAEPEDELLLSEEGIKTWSRCDICKATTEHKNMNDGAFLFSFAKFLEVLVYSPSLSSIDPSLCEHTNSAASSGEDWKSSTRYNIIRHFSYKSSIVTFKMSPIEDIFEVRVPRLQIIRGLGAARNSITAEPPRDGDEEKKKLRREIKTWWEGVADHMDKLEERLSAGETLKVMKKALPRLPSEDDAYDDFEVPLRAASVSASPPPHSPITGLPPGAPQTPLILSDRKDYFSSSIKPEAEETTSSASSINSLSSDTASVTTPMPSKLSPSQLLSALRQTFHRTEQALYSQLSRTAPSDMNEVRRAFLSSARGAERRLQAWQKKHLTNGKTADKLLVQEPEWWDKTCHVVPGGNIIVREDDWGSIIAFTMSTPEYHRELANMTVVRTGSTSAESVPPASPAINSSSFFAAATGYKLFKTSTSQPDPDKEDVVWHEPEAYSAVITRKEHPRDPASLLSLREVLRQKTPLDSVLTASRFGSISASSKGAGTPPPSAWSKPEVQLSIHVADGEVTGQLDSSGESVGKLLHEIESSSDVAQSRPGSSLSSTFPWTSGFTDSHVKRGKASSIISVDSDATVGPDPMLLTSEPVVETGEASNPETAEEEPNHSARSASTFTNTLTSGLTHAMRFMLNNPDTQRSTSSSSSKHGLLSGDVNHIDERPHIKYDWTIGKRLKFSCTVYYAKQFDSLRKRCGVDEIFIKSLSRSHNWAAEGGKSKSNFWKTKDDRFIIKTLVNAWNVADLQVLIDLAPSYFRYMDATASKATVLAKLIGFYTIEIRNLESGAVQSKVDLLVTENIFYSQNVIKTFDLKGIQGRKVKEQTSPTGSTRTNKTLFDGEWIEGQQRTLTLVRPHSKVILQEAIKSDAEFLAKSNIMDYSLLLGIDQSTKQIACGLVDTIGSYTFAKTLEYKAKQGLNSGSKEVTVIPPTEYQERFVNALDGYFVACPDKWSKRIDGGKSTTDPAELPSVM